MFVENTIGFFLFLGPSGAPRPLFGLTAQTPLHRFWLSHSLDILNSATYSQHCLYCMDGPFMSGLTLTNWLSVHRGQVFLEHFEVWPGFWELRMSLIFSPPFSTILILSSLNLLRSASLFLNLLARIPPGVGVTNKTLLYCVFDFSLFHQFCFLFKLVFFLPSIFQFFQESK